MVQIQANISLKEWQNYQNGEEAIAHNNVLENETFIRILFSEKELIAMENNKDLSFIIKKTF